MPDHEASRRRAAMVERQIVARGLRSGAVLDAMRAVPREAFVPQELREFAYEDQPLPIDEGQTISQPYMVALMIDALRLRGADKVLEIGTGSGYAAAVLARIAADVYTVERLPGLADAAALRLALLRCRNVHVCTGDGTLGWPIEAPYDAIVVTAGGPQVPASLQAQLRIGGRLVIPVGSSRSFQQLLRLTRVAPAEYLTEELAAVCFVPLLGEQGW